MQRCSAFDKSLDDASCRLLCDELLGFFHLPKNDPYLSEDMDISTSEDSDDSRQLRRLSRPKIFTPRRTLTTDCVSSGLKCTDGRTDQFAHEMPNSCYAVDPRDTIQHNDQCSQPDEVYEQQQTTHDLPCTPTASTSLLHCNTEDSVSDDSSAKKSEEVPSVRPRKKSTVSRRRRPRPKVNTRSPNRTIEPREIPSNKIVRDVQTGRFVCKYDNCFVTFSRKNDADRHFSGHYQRFQCGYCKSSSPRKDHIKEHLKDCHKGVALKIDVIPIS